MLTALTTVKCHGYHMFIHSLIELIQTLAWLAECPAYSEFNIGNLNRDVAQMLQRQLGWLVIINASSNFFIYFWRAPEYR
ncbi:hypothetical protein ANCDUO_02279 [Ancylostoma duodenale]|uniref:Uncharacterized protein n=1 Tax=Ancylostoma duodenale TaxID=51022 RepID=A0A0C2DC33_9BILA|nr:hypothetical protein ANCDUO_02279 [Ancylostoma duodenale]